MLGSALRADVVGFNATIASCGRCGQWQLAWQLLPRFWFGRAFLRFRTSLHIFLWLRDSADSLKCSPINPINPRNPINPINPKPFQSIVLPRFWSMHDLELAPSLVSFSAAFGSLERAGQWQLALHLHSKMQLSGATPDSTTYSSLLGALASSSQWQKALRLFAGMPIAKLGLDVLALNLAIQACVAGGQWQAALGLVAGMPTTQVSPNPTTLALALGAAEQGQQWSVAPFLLGRLARLPLRNCL